MSGEVLVWKNFHPVENAEYCISVFERGFQYGDGFFTTALIKQSQLLNWSAHKARLQMSAKRLRFPELDFETLEQSLRNQFITYGQTDCVCKIMVTRGVGGRGYLPPETPDVQVLSMLMPVPDFKHQPDNVAQVSPIILEISPETSGVKHLNRLSNVLARKTMNVGFDEAVMLNAFGQVQCATQSNIFVIKDHQIITPRVNLSGVEGTARSCLLTLAKEQVLTMDDVLNADTLFFTNAVRGVQVINNLNLNNWSNLQRKFLQFGLSQLQDLPAGICFPKVVGDEKSEIMKTFETKSPLLEKVQQAFLHHQYQNALKLN
ncbi:aminodeoxychorismate lyase [Thiomicrorhabdus indica]|uniref:aminodeoxychorismate lyase n=1 Tax=Thiomicrorhabdus indica TaxID=2267253 RepID=UPI00102D8EB9|nr:aminodeoxychorismate lyase [Thiomicrorhabdus indica]